MLCKIQSQARWNLLTEFMALYKFYHIVHVPVTKLTCNEDQQDKRSNYKVLRDISQIATTVHSPQSMAIPSTL